MLPGQAANLLHKCGPIPAGIPIGGQILQEITMRPCIVAAPDGAAEGRQRIDWVRRHMPILNQLEVAFRKEQPLRGLRVVVSVHLEAKTAYLALVLRSAGAQVAVTGSNPESTKDEVAAALLLSL